MQRKKTLLVFLFLLNGCSLYSENIQGDGKITSSIPPAVLLLTSFISPTPYDTQIQPTIHLKKRHNKDEKETISLVDFDKLPKNQRDIILYSFKYLTTRINRKEVVISLNEEYSVKEIKKMIDNNSKAIELPNNKIKKQWSSVVNRLKKIKGFKEQNPKIFLLSNKYKIRNVFSETFDIKRENILS